jgi:hypothetical protein
MVYIDVAFVVLAILATYVDFAAALRGVLQIAFIGAVFVLPTSLLKFVVIIITSVDASGLSVCPQMPAHRYVLLLGCISHSCRAVSLSTAMSSRH